MSIDYTLFKPNGSPLRAKLNLKFVKYMTNKEAVELAKNQSSDISHIKKIKTSDTLQSLCFEVYGDGNYCTDVAFLNNLTSFRNLKPGINLVFSPLK